ncbi:hypothetical protein [Halorarum halobium]|uniref:hypothetical protein n=1 Tax=Halorarum halobium TaxID=3075121 RepID=UPI0028A757C6|nr:hypothetical protein [Halobaculum sp. XH14]
MRRTHAALLLGVVLALGVALAVPLLADHVAAQRVDDVSATVTDVGTVDESTVAVDLELSNPAPRPLVVPDGSSTSGVYALGPDGEAVNEPRRTTVDGATLPAGGTGTITATLELKEAFHGQGADALAGTTLRGTLTLRLDGAFLETEITAPVGGDGG